MAATESTPSPPPTALVIAAFAAVYVVWGSTYVAIKFAIETVPPLTMAGTRFLTAGTLLYAIVRRHAAPPTSAQWRTTAVAGLLMLFVANGLVCWSEQYVPSGIAALLVATLSLWIVLLDWLVFNGTRPTRRVTVGLITGMIGVYLLVGRTGLEGEGLHVGGAIGLLIASASWAVGSLYTRRHPVPTSPFLSASMQMLAGGVALLIMGVALGEWRSPPAPTVIAAPLETGAAPAAAAPDGAPSGSVRTVDLSAVSLKSALAILYLVFFGSMLALSAYVWLLQVSTPAKVATYCYVNPMVAMGLGYLLAAEPLTASSVVAAVVIILAVVIITSARAPQRREATAIPVITPHEACAASACDLE